MENSKKGEISTGFFITLVLLIAGFAIMILFIFNFNIGERVDKKVCHEAIILRAGLGELPSIVGYSARNSISIKCKTGKYCLTTKFFGKGDCSEFIGEKYTTVRVSSDLTKQNDEINRFIAREMADCWTMFGEGKIQIFSREATTSSSTSRCMFCSRIAFSKELKEQKNSEFSGLISYMYSHKVPNKDYTYTDAFGWSNSIKKQKSLFQDYEKYSMEQKTIIFSESSKSTLPSWILIGSGGTAAGVGGAIVGAKIGGIIGTVIPVGGTIVGGAIGFVGGAVVGGFSGALIGDNIESSFNINQIFQENLKKNEKNDAAYSSSIGFVDYNSNVINNLKCASFENIP